MNLSGIKGLVSMAVIVLLVSGCSTQSKPEYDPLEVILWEACINDYLESAQNFQTEKAQATIWAEEFCLPLLPTRRD